MAPTSTADLEAPVAYLPELPKEVWALVAAHSGVVGAQRLTGGLLCKAATEGWGF